MKDYKKIIPERFYDTSYENDVDDKIKKIVKEQLNKEEGVYIYGKSGVGKTHIVCALCKHFLEHDIDVRFYNTGEFLERLREEHNKSYEGEGGLLIKVMDFRGILVLDDIGVGKPSPWTRDRLYTLLSKRYDSKWPVFFTSNFDLESLKVEFGGDDRLISRISDMTERIKKNGEDRRLK